MPTHASPLLIALKPTYADLVFDGLKTAELRRRISPHIVNRDVYVYVSSPVMALRGGFRAGQVWSGSPEEIWAHVSNFAAVSRRDFNNYYQGQTVAFAVEILNVWEFAKPLPLSELRKRFPGFVTPQSYRYLKPDEVRSFQKLKRVCVEARAQEAV